MTEEIKIKELTKKRASIKSQLTQFTSFLNVSKSCDQLSEEQLVELELRVDKMVTVYATYDQLQGQLECLSAKPDEQFTEREQFEAIYYKQLASARALLTQHRTQLANKRTKWTDSDGVLEEGAMVVLKEQQTPPLMWPLGRIVRLIAGRDGISRVADVKTKRGIVRRAYNTICPLPV
ncbi:uncharacterized protein LOC126056356 isoform X3 [Helicoverpa armigera]|uniref:uncharacterized protein LOC126056356 isoform X3 n=1 Tax=Helicoverpa armigera TaxID=29058 RepID=UPI002111BC3C|nr:uncharacterized protein LOC126056356 isoform X3 [Helicoverpa armigera]